MQQLSERVQKEFDKWQNEYEIPTHEEFQVKTLLKLQEEYDNIKPDSSNTKTRETLIRMIRPLHDSLRLSPKLQQRMYVDYYKNNNTHNIDKILIYLNDETYTLQGNSYKTFKDYASIIAKLAINNNAIIYINTIGFGEGLYRELVISEGVVVKKMKTNKEFIINEYNR